MKKEMLRKNNGITLITIAITIIILLILSSITITIMTGDDGLARRAEKTKQSSDDNVLIETLQIEIANCYDEHGNLDMEKAKDVLEKSKTFDVGKYNKDLIVNYGERSILIESTGDLTIIGEEIKPNPPRLTSGMIPVKYDTQKENWVICSKDDEEWYSYTSNDKKWANIMLSDGKYNEQTPIGTVVQEQDLGSMFVWIPRYAYKITSGYHSNGYGEIDVKWVDGTSYYYLDGNKKRKVAQNGNTEGVITSTGYTDYVVHPAFTDGSSNSYSNGEWKKEVTGIWVAKFEAGIYTNSNDTNSKISSVNNYYFPVFKGKKYAYNYVNISQSYNISLALSKSGNPYGLTSNANSHLLKNSEWGASTYLSISKYGYTGGNTDGQEVYKNNLGLVDNAKYTTSNVSHPNNSSWKIVAITGYCAQEKASSQNVMTYTSYEDLKAEVSGTNGKSYAWNNVEKNSDSGKGTKASTTGNIYGIYDMAGTLSEDVAAYINAPGARTVSNGSSMINGERYLGTAYPYNPTSVNNREFFSAYPGFSKIFGDGIYEMSKAMGDGNAWFNQWFEKDTTNDEIYFTRSVGWFGVPSGILRNGDNRGEAEWYAGFRSVLIPD